MKALVSVLILVFSILSCDIRFPSYISDQYDSNPFLEVYDISESMDKDSKRIPITEERKHIEKDVLRFISITDVHIGRNLVDSGIKYFNDNFYSYLDSKNPEFIMCLGDLSDDGIYSKDIVNFVLNSAARSVNKWFLYCIGNHERHVFDSHKWHQDSDEVTAPINGFDVKHFSGTMALYCYGDLLSIYKLDNSMRVFGQKQLMWMEEALKQDKSKYKMVIMHDNVITGGALDQSLFLTGFADIQERNKFFSLMNKYKVGVVLSGHHHKGNIVYKANANLAELNLAAYHQRDTLLDFESDGYFYECLLDTKSGKFTVNGFLAESSNSYSEKPDITFEFILPSSN